MDRMCALLWCALLACLCINGAPCSHFVRRIGAPVWGEGLVGDLSLLFQDELNSTIVSASFGGVIGVDRY